MLSIVVILLLASAYFSVGTVLPANSTDGLAITAPANLTTLNGSVSADPNWIWQTYVSAIIAHARETQPGSRLISILTTSDEGFVIDPTKIRPQLLRFVKGEESNYFYWPDNEEGGTDDPTTEVPSYLWVVPKRQRVNPFTVTIPWPPRIGLTDAVYRALRRCGSFRFNAININLAIGPDPSVYVFIGRGSKAICTVNLETGEALPVTSTLQETTGNITTL